MILVTTAGKVGSEATRLLAAMNQPVSVLVRPGHDTRPITGRGVRIVEGDLGDRASIERAMVAVTGVVLVTPGVPDHELTLIEAARAAGATHVVKVTSDASADSPVGRRRDHHRIEEALEASGLAYTLLRSNAYMQNFLALAPLIARESRFASATGEGKIGMVDSRDVADVAATVAVTPSPHAGKTYWLSGPRHLSYTDAAGEMTDVLHRRIVHQHVSADQQVQMMVDAGMPVALARTNTQALELFAQGDADWISDGVFSVVGREPRTFESFVLDHTAAFTSETS